MDVADAAVLTGIAPRPAQAFVEQVEHFSGRELADGFGIVAWRPAQHRVLDDRPSQRFGIMRRDDASGERDVGEILAIGVELRIGFFRRSGEREFVSADARRPGPDR